MPEKQETSKKTAKFLESAPNKRIRELLDERNIKTDEFAQALSVTPEAIRLWNAGYARPDIDKLLTIATYFNVSMDYLFGKTDVKSCDMEIKEMSEKLGLSERVTAILKDYSYPMKQRDINGGVLTYAQKAKPPKDINAIIGSGFFWSLVRNLWVLKNIRSDKLPNFMKSLRCTMSTSEFRKYIIHTLTNELQEFLNKVAPFEETFDDHVVPVDVAFDSYEDVLIQIHLEESNETNEG